MYIFQQKLLEYKHGQCLYYTIKSQPTPVFSFFQKDLHQSQRTSQDGTNEYTMREFIGPVLVGALRLVQIFLKKTGNIGRLSLICEKIIVGLHAHGPVDYVVDYF